MKTRSENRLIRVRNCRNMWDVVTGSRFFGWVIKSAQGKWYHNRNSDEFEKRKDAVKALLKIK